MTIDELKELFEKHHPAYLTGDASTPSWMGRPDLSAFMLLHRLVPESVDIIACAEHDQIWLSTDIEKLAAVATEADIESLVAFGVRLDEDTDSLSMFA